MTQELEAETCRDTETIEMLRAGEMETETAAETGEAEDGRVASREYWRQAPPRTGAGSGPGVVLAQNVFTERTAFLSRLCSERS